MWGHMGDFGWGWDMGIGMLLYWGLLIAVIVALVRLASGQSRSQSAEKTALELLKERYARGEIEREEFLQKKQDLER